MLTFGWFPGVWNLYADVSEHYVCSILPLKMEQTECSETSAYKFHTPGNHPKESIQHSVHGESLKSRLHSYLLTPRSRVLLVKLTFSQVVKKFPALYGTRWFINAFTRAHYLSLSWARSIQSVSSIPLPEDHS